MQASSAPSDYPNRHGGAGGHPQPVKSMPRDEFEGGGGGGGGGEHDAERGGGGRAGEQSSSLSYDAAFIPEEEGAGTPESAQRHGYEGRESARERN